MTTLARLADATRRFGEVVAVDDVSLEIEEGTILGLLGPNGAGKTTVISMLQGRRRPTSGTVELFGGNPVDAENRRLLCSTPQETALPEALRVGEVIDFVGLSHLADQPAGVLSGGQQKLLELARILMVNPSVILLDEPAAGVNPVLLESLMERIVELNRRGITFLLIEHNMDMVMSLCSPVVVMAQGKVVMEGDPETVRNDARVIDAYLGDQP